MEREVRALRGRGSWDYWPVGYAARVCSSEEVGGGMLIALRTPRL